MKNFYWKDLSLYNASDIKIGSINKKTGEWGGILTLTNSHINILQCTMNKYYWIHILQLSFLGFPLLCTVFPDIMPMFRFNLYIMLIYSISLSVFTIFDMLLLYKIINATYPDVLKALYWKNSRYGVAVYSGILFCYMWNLNVSNILTIVSYWMLFIMAIIYLFIFIFYNNLFSNVSSEESNEW